MIKLTLIAKIIAVAAMLVVCFIALGYVVLGQYRLHIASDAVQFQEYAPLALPPNTSIKSRDITVVMPWSYSLLPHYTKQLDLYLNDMGTSIIEEQKNINFRYVCEAGKGSVNETCVLAETPRHQQYLLTSSYVQQEVEWLKGDTFIWIVLEGNPAQTYSQAIWSKVIDSFVPTHYSKLPVRYYYQGGP